MPKNPFGQANNQSKTVSGNAPQGAQNQAGPLTTGQTQGGIPNKAQQGMQKDANQEVGQTGLTAQTPNNNLQ